MISLREKQDPAAERDHVVRGLDLEKRERDGEERERERERETGRETRLAVVTNGIRPAPRRAWGVKVEV